jgi:hypothetical protein
MQRPLTYDVGAEQCFLLAANIKFSAVGLIGVYCVYLNRPLNVGIAGTNLWMAAKSVAARSFLSGHLKKASGVFPPSRSMAARLTLREIVVCVQCVRLRGFDNATY